jgi:hypothetical protein
LLLKLKTAPLKEILDGTIPTRTIELPKLWRFFAWWYLVSNTLLLSCVLGSAICTLLIFISKIGVVAFTDLSFLEYKTTTGIIIFIAFISLSYATNISLKSSKDDLIRLLGPSTLHTEYIYFNNYQKVRGLMALICFVLLPIALIEKQSLDINQGLAGNIGWSTCAIFFLVDIFFSFLIDNSKPLEK